MHKAEILKSVLKKIRPSATEQKYMSELTQRIVRTANQCGATERAFIKALICGSTEKGTWLANRKETDVFLLFDPALSKTELKQLGLKIAKCTIEKLRGSYTIAYAEHPYLRGKVKFKEQEYSIDIVPAYDIKDPSKIKSAVDRSPHHVRYVKQHMNRALADQARLLKAFMKAAGCYGADTKTRGFSGYLCELLTIKYGSFLAVLSAAADIWEAGQVIALDHIEPKAAFEKFHSPLIVIDPVDPNRNVAAAVSAESLFKFIQRARHFLRAPSEKFFFPTKPKPYSLKEISAELASRGTRLYLIHFPRPAVIDDILWPQMRRALYIIDKLLQDAGFRLLRSAEWADESQCVLLLEFEVWQVPKIIKHVGPSIYAHKQVRAFLEHYADKRAFIENDRWVVERERAHKTALHYLKDILTQPKKILLSKGIPNKLVGINTANIVSGADAIRLIQKLPEEFRIFLKEYFEKDLR